MPILLCAGAVAAETQADTFTFYTDSPLVSVGDQVVVSFRMSLGLGLPGSFTYAYRLPDAAHYIPDSFFQNGSSIPDSDPRLSVSATEVRFTLLTLPGQTTTFSLKLRATGAIGEAIHHQAEISGIIPTRRFRARPTRIEDETAELLIPDLLADAMLSEQNGTWNYGSSSELAVSKPSGQRQRSLLRFDMTALSSAIPSGWEVHSAFIEMYPHRTHGNGVLEVRPLRLKWTEGIMDGAPCLGGATWTTSNCVDPWTGGKLDKSIADLYLTQNSSYVEMDITQYVVNWLNKKPTENGLALLNGSGDLDLLLPSREAARDSSLSPRLVVVAAPRGSYETSAAASVKAEIIPTDVIAGIGSMPFHYWLLPDIRFENTGINRVSISIPADFTLTSVDSLSIGGVVYQRGDGSGLAPFEFENWGTPSRVDVRFFPALTWLDGNPPIRLVLHAVPPEVPTPGREFPSTVDHDRRGQPSLNAREGNANPADPPGDSDSWKVRATSTNLVRVDVTPRDTTVAVGYSVSYRAMAVFADSSRFDVGSSAAWTVVPDSLGNFDTSGQFEAQHTGNGMVDATWNGQTSSAATLQVDPPELVALHIHPDNQSVAVGASTSFGVTGTYSNGDSLDLTGIATWTLQDTLLARFTAPGSVVGQVTGNTVVQASLDGLVDTANLNVTPAELLQILVSPADTSVAHGFDVQMQAIGMYTDGSSADITSIVAWNSSPTGVVDIGVEGLVTTLDEGTTSITASHNDVESSGSTFTVLAPILVSLDGSPDSTSVTVQSFYAVQSWGTYSDGSLINLTADVQWTSLDPSIADFVTPGTVTALAPGTARLTHALQPLVGDTLTVEVTPATVESLVVQPRSLVLPPGSEYFLSATGTWSDGSSQDVTAQSLWSSDNPVVASVGGSGQIAAHVEGVAVLTASFGGVSDTCSLMVNLSAFDSLLIQPNQSTIPLGIGRQHSAFAYRDGVPLDVTSGAQWSTADSLIAQVDSSGVVTGMSVGVTTLHASIGMLTAPPIPLEITDAVVTGLSVQPATSTLRLGTSKQLTAWATRSDGEILDVTNAVTWVSNTPGVVYIQPDGLALGLSLGTATVTSSLDDIDSSPSELEVLPSVQLEAQPIGNLVAAPSTRNALLLSTRLVNHDVQPHVLSAVRVDVRGPTDSLRLWMDQGDGIFDPDTDLLAVAGQTPSGRWTATNLSAALPVGGSQLVYVSADVSTTHATHGDTLDASIGGDADLFWDGPTATVAPGGFPLDSFGEVTAENLVLSQMPFEPQPADTVFPGAAEVPLLRFTLPDDGGLADILTRITVHQIGTAEADVDVQSLRFQVGALQSPGDTAGSDKTGRDLPQSAWQDVALLVHTGAGQWVASGLSVSVASGGAVVRVCAALSSGAREGRTLQLELPEAALTFDSGRSGPVDSGWTNPNSALIEAQHQLAIEQVLVADPDNPISRQAEAQVVLGLELTAWTADDDVLNRITLNHTSIGPTGSAADRDAEIQWAQLWWDFDANGRISGGDQHLDTRVPGATVPGEIDFGAVGGLNFPLPVAQPIQLLVTLTPHPTLVRDAEFLRVQLSDPASVETAGGLEVLLSAPVQTLTPPQVDGQDLEGYDVRGLSGSVLLAKDTNDVVMDLVLPANGFEDDTLEALRLENLGTATNADISAARLWRDDGNEIFDAGDSLVTVLNPVESRAWEASGIGLPLHSTDTRRFWITVDIASSAASGLTVQAAIPLGGLEVQSGNDGPIDAQAIGGEPNVISVQNRVTWLAGVVGSKSVPPDANDQMILVLDGFNGYSNARTLQSLDVAVRGSAAEQEFQLWRLHADTNLDGVLDAGDTALAVTSITNGMVHFNGFSWDMLPGQQQRLLVSYSLSTPMARDASQVDAVVESRNAFGFAQGTQSTGTFELDSPGIDSIDGMIRNQITNIAVPQRSLGGGEVDVLSLDLLLPSNGWQVDTLEALQVQLAQTAPAAVYGTDILDVELWRESDSSPVGASFDPAQDIYLQRAVQNAGGLLFTNLNSILPVGGHRFYVTVDVSATPADSARIQLVLPKNGVTMRSGNDGPLDQSIQDTAVHTVSSSDLLASVDVSPLLVSRGQQISVGVTVRNQSSVQIDSVIVQQLLVDPPGAASQVSGPNPAFVTLAPQSEASIVYGFSMDVSGDARFRVVASAANGSKQSDPAQSSLVHVEEPPSALALLPLSTLPSSVNRGQISVTPLIWRLSHPDTDSLAADISIDTVRVEVQSTTGVPQLASDVLSSLEIRTGGLIHADWSTIPPDTLLTIPLTVPVVLTAGEERDLPLTVSIASDASASGFKLHLEGSGAVGAADANSSQPISLVANLPWSTQSASILTPATDIELLATETLPSTLNRGQTDFPGGALTFILPGAPGEREVRITGLTLGFEAGGAAVLAQDVFSRIRVRHGTTTLLDLQDLQSTGPLLTMPLAIPKVVASGDSVRLELSFDLLNAVGIDDLSIILPDSSAVEVRDSNSGTPVRVSLSSGTFPWIQGPGLIQSPAQLLAALATPTAPTGTFPAAQQMPLLDLRLIDQDPPGSATMRIESLAFETLDDLGNALVPTSVVNTARLLQDTTVLAQTSVAMGQQMLLVPATPLLLAPGDTMQVSLQVDLSAALAQPWVRFHLPSSAIVVHDANDASNGVSPSGLPASTALVRVVAEAAAVGLGALDHPQANVVPGVPVDDLLPIRIVHPGLANEADIQPRTLVVKLRDAASQALSTSGFLSTASLAMDTLRVDAALEGDSLVFDLAPFASLSPGEAQDAFLQIEVEPSSAVSDFRVALAAQALRATSGGGTFLTVQPVGTLGLPYVSPTIHVNGGSLAQSFASYPNPFIPAQGPCHITFFLPSDGQVTCDIYSLSGDRVVRLLDRQPRASGMYDDVVWDGRNERGDMVRNGTYLLRIQVDGAGGGEFHRKLAVIR